MSIKKSEIKSVIKTVLLSIFSFYLVFPLREFINEFLNISTKLFWQFVIGIIGILIVAWLFKID